MANEEVPQFDVAIIGGGPIGLTVSIMLSLRGIKNVLYERHPNTSIHPKACGINQRTTEIFRKLGIEDEVYHHAAPAEVSGRTAWYTSLGPNGREIVSRDAWGFGKYAVEYKAHSPSSYCVLPQIRLEPILKRRALALNPKGINYHSEVTKTEQHKDHVTLTIRNRSNNAQFQANARYVLAADGGRSMTDDLGVAWKGERNIFDMVTAHFRSPLRALHPDPQNFITWFSNPEMGGSTKTGYLYQIGPWPLEDLKPNDEEWVFVCALTDKDPKKFDQKTMTRRLRETLAIEDLPVEMLSFSHWNVNAIYADKYRVGRIFLVGDAAHRIPPWGALGMNSGMADIMNVVWKLELALKDEKKYDALLDTYETERQPVGKRVGISSLHNCRNHAGVMDAALGVSEEKSVEENVKNVNEFFDSNNPKFAEKKAAVERAQKVLDLEFKAPGTEIGWFYPSVDRKGEGGKFHGGQLLENGELNSEIYVPSTIPGHFVPHAWLEKGGKRCAVLDLVPLSQMLLLAGKSGWETLGDERVQYEVIDSDNWVDVDGVWMSLRGVFETGAVLVRPDGIVQWRGEMANFTPQSWKEHIDSML
jgi:2-polyprenyl-6-methoxyphenol hydroxylase-like FAD-dependent oxidoreductase